MSEDVDRKSVRRYPKTSDFSQAVRSLIKELRNGRDVERNWPAFKQLVEEDRKRLFASLSVRWLKAVCDTYVDFGDPVESRNAMAITMFLNMLRVAETVRFVRGDIIPEKLAEATTGRTVTYEELRTLNIERQDTLLNVSKRMRKTLNGSGLMEAIWCEILTRINASPSVIAELRDLSSMPDRFFPVDPTDMADNHGVV